MTLDPSVTIREITKDNSTLVFREIHQKMRGCGKSQYVRYTRDCWSRTGSIARVKRASVPSMGYGGGSLWLEYDQRKYKEYEFAYWEEGIEWLVGYDGPTNYVYNRSKNVYLPAEVPAVYDRLGKEIHVGDFIIFTHFIPGQMEDPLYFGMVKEIKNEFDQYDTGAKNVIQVIYCENVPMKDGDTIREHRVTKHSRLVVLHEGMKEEVLLRKLSNTGVRKVRNK